ncbi:hypothetical protein [Armatimonas rosea]|uniref:DUF2336 domain-containing protein n=1 Tax=Armatimonas rosea TaxID=685828 RepID=A0A7W9SU23_ARMRO|nr:hypothetical protein [Armatimonas rosea]MBB6052343.1 hypothetical protein [Armatimonas rosea]
MTPALALQLAEDPHSTLEQLVATQVFLSRPAIAQALATNPNTPPETLAKLLARYPERVFANPALPLIVLTGASFLEAVDRKELVQLLQRLDVPEFFLRALTVHRDPKVAETAELHIRLGAAQPGWEDDLVRRLSRLKLDHAERQLLVARRLLPSWLESALPPSKQPLTVPKPGESLTNAQLLSAIPIKHRGVYDTPQLLSMETPLQTWLEETIQTCLQNSGVLVWFVCALHLDSLEKLTTIARYPTWYLRLAIALNVHTDMTTLTLLTNDANRYVRVVAQNRLDDASWRFTR